VSVENYKNIQCSIAFVHPCTCSS